MKTKILIAAQVCFIIKMIQHGLELHHISCITAVVQSMKKFEMALNQFKPDLIIAHYCLSFLDGTIAFDIKEKLPQKNPFVFVPKIAGKANAVVRTDPDSIFLNNNDNLMEN